MATSTFYPDADPETSTVDGATRFIQDVTWTNLIGAANASNVLDNTVAVGAPRLFSRATAGIWGGLFREIFLFDTSSIGSDTVDSATFSLAAAGSKIDNFSQSLVVCSSSPASNTALAVGDHDSYGTTDFSSRITLASWDATDTNYNDFTFVSAGISAIDTGGITKLGFRLSGDIDNVEPSHPGSVVDCQVSHYYTDNGTNKPKLVVVHSASGGGVRRYFSPGIWRAV